MNDFDFMRQVDYQNQMQTGRINQEYVNEQSGNVQMRGKHPDHKDMKVKSVEKRLYSLKEFTQYTGFGMTRAREIARRHESDFVIRMGNKIFVDIQKFNAYMDRCMEFGVPIS